MKRDRIPELLDALVVNPHYSTAGRKIGVNAATIFHYSALAKRRPRIHRDLVRRRSPVRRSCTQSNQNVGCTDRIAGSHFRMAGWDEPVVFQGKQCFVEDERCAGIDPDLFELLGLPSLRHEARCGWQSDSVDRTAQAVRCTRNADASLAHAERLRRSISGRGPAFRWSAGCRRTQEPDAGRLSGSSLGQIKDVDYVEIDEDMKPVEKRGGYLVVGAKKDEAELEVAYGGKQGSSPLISRNRRLRVH